MMMKKELLQYRLELLMSESDEDIKNNLQSAEDYIDVILTHSFFKNTHEVYLQELKKEVLLTEEQFTKLVQILFVKYTLGDWSISISDEFLVFS